MDSLPTVEYPLCSQFSFLSSSFGNSAQSSEAVSGRFVTSLSHSAVAEHITANVPDGWELEVFFPVAEHNEVGRFQAGNWPYKFYAVPACPSTCPRSGVPGRSVLGGQAEEVMVVQVVLGGTTDHPVPGAPNAWLSL